MGSGDPLGTTTTEFAESISTETIILDDPTVKLVPKPSLGQKRKWGALVEEEVRVFSNMAEVVKDVVVAIRDSKMVYVHPNLYVVVMF